MFNFIIKKKTAKYKTKFSIEKSRGKCLKDLSSSGISNELPINPFETKPIAHSLQTNIKW